MLSFLGVKYHYINEELFNLVLANKEVDEANSGKNIAAWLEAVLEGYEISPSSEGAVVTDNGTNIVNTCVMLNENYVWDHVHCAAHKHCNLV